MYTRFLDDLDGDGVAEIAIGDDGWTWILSGKTRAILDRVVRGGGLIHTGDLDRDGVRDLLVKLPGIDKDLPAVWPNGAEPATDFSSTAPRSARVRVLSGRDRRTLHEVDVPGGGWTGMCSGGDFDRDGFADFVILLVDVRRATFWPARIEIRSGSDGAPIASFEARADAQGYDSNLQVVADVDGDGVPELLVVSSPTYRYNDPSMVRCLSGSDGQMRWSKVLGRDEVSVGHTILDAGDWDGDGSPDVIFNAPAFDGPDWNNRRPVRVLALRDGREIDSFVSTESRAVETKRAFATGIAVVRGARSDGRAELWCGSVSTNFLASTGMLEVFGPDHSVARVRVPECEPAEGVPFGNSLRSGADVTGDGVEEVLVSGYEWYGGVSGSVLLVCGRTRHVLQRFDPDALDREWGRGKTASGADAR